MYLNQTNQMNPMLSGMLSPMGMGGGNMMQQMQAMMMQMMSLMMNLMGGMGAGGCGCQGGGMMPQGYPNFGGGNQMGSGNFMGGNSFGQNFLGGQGQHCGNYNGNYASQGGGFPPGTGLVQAPGGQIGGVNVDSIVSNLPRNQQNSARQHFPGIIAEAQRQGITNKDQLAYILATASHESGSGKHMREFASGRAYEGRRDLGNTQPGDGQRFKGRGYVQITGRRNYEMWSRRLGIDLVNNPELASRPDIAAKILVQGMKEGTFTGRGLDRYINNSGTNFAGARRIVNGTDRAGHIGSIAQRLSYGIA